MGAEGRPERLSWFTESAGDKVGRITTQGRVTEFALPTPAGGTTPGLASLTAGPDGAIWAIDGATGRELWQERPVVVSDQRTAPLWAWTMSMPVGSATTAAIGPFGPDLANATDGTVHLSYSSVTSVTVAAVTC